MKNNQLISPCGKSITKNGKRFTIASLGQHMRDCSDTRCKAEYQEYIKKYPQAAVIHIVKSDSDQEVWNAFVRSIS